MSALDMINAILTGRFGTETQLVLLNTDKVVKNSTLSIEMIDTPEWEKVGSINIYVRK